MNRAAFDVFDLARRTYLVANDWAEVGPDEWQEPYRRARKLPMGHAVNSPLYYDVHYREPPAASDSRATGRVSDQPSAAALGRETRHAAFVHGQLPPADPRHRPSHGARARDRGLGDAGPEGSSRARASRRVPQAERLPLRQAG